MTARIGCDPCCRQVERLGMRFASDGPDNAVKSSKRCALLKIQSEGTLLFVQRRRMAMGEDINSRLNHVFHQIFP